MPAMTKARAPRTKAPMSFGLDFWAIQVLSRLRSRRLRTRGSDIHAGAAAGFAYGALLVTGGFTVWRKHTPSRFREAIYECSTSVRSVALLGSWCLPWPKHDLVCVILGGWTEPIASDVGPRHAQ